MDLKILLKEYIKQLNEMHYEDIRVSRGWREFFNKYGSEEKVKKLGYDIDDLYVNFNSHAKDKMDKRINYSPDKKYGAFKSDKTYAAGAHDDPGGIYGYPLEYIITHPLSETYGMDGYPYMRVLLNKNNKRGMGYSDNDENNLQARKKDTLRIDKIDDIMDARYLMIRAAEIMPSVYGGYDELFKDKNIEQMRNFYKNMYYLYLKSEYGENRNMDSYAQFLYFLLKHNVCKIFDKVKLIIADDYEDLGHETVELNVNTFINSLFDNYHSDDYYKNEIKNYSLPKISSKDMNTVLRKLGFGVLDSKETDITKSIIPDEPSQAIFLDRQSFEVLDIYELFSPVGDKKTESEKEVSERYVRILKKMALYIFGEGVFLSKDKSNVRAHADIKSSRSIGLGVAIEIKGDMIIVLRTVGESYSPKFSGGREDSKYKFDTSDKFTENKSLVFEVFIRNGKYNQQPFFSYQLRPDQTIESALPMIKYDLKEKMEKAEKDNAPNE
jgi:hypothetical protein